MKAADRPGPLLRRCRGFGGELPQAGLHLQQHHPAGSGFAYVQNAYKPSAFFDGEGRLWRRRDVDDTGPKSPAAEEEFDLLRAAHATDCFHGRAATRAKSWVGTPNLENEVPPQGAHGAGGSFRGRRDNQNGCGRGCLGAAALG